MKGALPEGPQPWAEPLSGGGSGLDNDTLVEGAPDGGFQPADDDPGPDYGSYSDGGSSSDGNEPSLQWRAPMGDWRLVDFGAGFAIDSNRVAWLRHHYGYVKHGWCFGISVGIG